MRQARPRPWTASTVTCYWRGVRGRRLLEPVAVVLAMGVLTTLVFRDALISGRVFFQHDVQLMWHTQATSFVRAVTRGEWPTWNPWIGFGQPLWGDANTQVVYPFTWLNLLLHPWDYYKMLVLAHFVAGGLGVHLLARHLGSTRGAASFAAALWLLSGAMVSIVEYAVLLVGAAWVPWVLLAGFTAVERGRLAAALAWGLCQAMQLLGGAPELATMSAGLVGAYALVATGGRGRERLARLTLAAAVAVAVAAGLSAAQWLPSLEVASRSVRAHLPEAVRTYWSVHPGALLQTLLPVPLHELHLRPELRATLFEGREPFLASLYLGLPTVAFAGAALCGRHRRAALFFLACFTALVLVALGRNTPVYALLAALLPPVKMLRYPVKAMIPAGVCWVLVCAWGFDAWAGREGSPRSWRLVVAAPLAAMLAIAAVAAVLLGVWPERWAPLFLTNPWSAFTFRQLLGSTVWKLGLASVSAGLVLGLALLRRDRPAAAMAAAITLAGLLLVHDRLSPSAPQELYTYRPPPLSFTEPPERARLYSYDYYMADRGARYLGGGAPYQLTQTSPEWPFPAATALAMRLSLFPPTPGAWGVAGSFERDTPAIAPPFIAQLYDHLLAAEGTPAHLRLLQVGAVTRVFARHTEGFETLRRLASLDLLLPEPLLVFEVPDALPRAYAVEGARIADGVTAIHLLLDPGFDPRREVILPGGQPVPPSDGFQDTARVVRLGADRVTVEAELAGPGWVVLVDAYDPNWTVAVDGGEAEVLRANTAFRAVAVPAGRHVLEYRYRPPSVRHGVAVSALTCLLLLALGARSIRRRTLPRD